jgi:tRNA uridine 5-carbamoylmethylation protein Kti12
VTLIVNLFAGPGAGKSTTAAELFSALKRTGHEAEIASEYAKDLTWEHRQDALHFQPYVCVKQMYRVHRLIGQVDVVITDSPILLALTYRGGGYTRSFEAFVLDIHRSWKTLNILLERQDMKRYSEKGRNQTRNEALLLDRTVRNTLDYHKIPYHVEPGPPTPPDSILRRITEALGE